MLEENKSIKVTKRGLYILLVILLGVGIMFSRFVYIQAAKEVQGQDLETLLEQRWSQSRVIDGTRGTIFDRNGEALAEEIPSYTLVAIVDDRFNSYVSDPKFTAEQLSTVLDMDASTIENFLSNAIENERVQVELGPRAKFLNYETMEKINELELDGVTFREDARRFYPNQTFASHVLGYTERDMAIARMGLESSLDEFLKEEDGRITYQKDALNRSLVNADTVIVEPKNGDHVFLTLDTRIQMAIEQTMNQVEEEFNPKRMMAIVANAKTGEILGMSNRPSFNPNQYESIVNYTNYNVSSRFEPGSTMKVFSLAAAIEEGVYDGEATFQSGSYQVGPHRIRDHQRGGWGEITFNEGVQRSSNVAFSILALEELGGDHLYDYLTSFGFEEPTGIDLPNEATGVLADSWHGDAAYTAFGQASVVTPIQQVQAATAIANGGKMMKPYIIDRIVAEDGSEVRTKNEPEIVGEPISENTSKEVLNILETVVSSDNGTGQPYAVEGFNIAGKTGTAEVPDPSGPGYLYGHGKHIFSFIGMAPADDPEVIMYVAVDRPELDATEIGSTPVSMIFKPVMQQSLQYLNISPTEEIGDIAYSEGIEMNDFIGSEVQSTISELESLGQNVVLIGEGDRIERQSPRPGTEVMPGEKVFLKTDGNEGKFPNMTNWSLRHLFVFQEVTGIEVEVNGEGFVREQSPQPGTSMKGVTRMRVTLLHPFEEVDETGLDEEVDDLLLDDDDNDDEFFMD
ncbi:penicillin-binding protein [Bacillus shivajii]|uniref:penicillin-binding protein n=1 Tax=Bacillus shivajii TaxID=1983719 RepID=UPI001CFC40BC|nr:penicillin-binding protein [Bacillus shivajii]UCZ51831.1 penicillin-binding protein [Bacillus shivajii]